MNEEQNGFRKGKSCKDCIFMPPTQPIGKQKSLISPSYCIIGYEKIFDKYEQEPFT